MLSPDQLTALFQKIHQIFRINEDAEITIEVNPADVNDKFLEKAELLGINRLNIGIQSFDDNILNFLGRRHNSNQAISSIHYAREAGFENLGIDLIYGIPGQSRVEWKKNLQYAVSLNIPHISCYQLTLEANTPLGSEYLRGSFEVPDNDELFEWFMETSIFLEESGYYHYEVSNFSLGKSMMSRHNSKYWRHVPYLGLGPAAHSFDGVKRWWNIRSLKSYFRMLNSDRLPVENCEELNSENLKLESLFLGFRTKAGIKLAEFEEKYGYDLSEDRKIVMLIEAGHLEIKNGIMQPTRTGMALADSMALL